MNTPDPAGAAAPATAPDDLIVLALFGTHDAADAAVRTLAGAGVPLGSISIVGKNYHREEHAVGYFNAGDRAWFYGKRAAFWGGLAGILLGSGFFYVPFVGSLVALGPLASAIAGGIEGAVLAGGASALYGALSAQGIPKNSVVRYETAIKSDQFLVAVHGPKGDEERIRQLLTQAGGTDVESHDQVAAP